MKSSGSNWTFSVLVIAATAAIYVTNFGQTYVNWDYSAYSQVISRTDYLTLARELLTDFQGKIVSGYYAPLSSISLMLDKMILGSGEPRAWQTLLINLVFHCLNAVLVVILLRELGISSRVSQLAMAVFLLHPLQVSSVLWFAQRKGVMAGAFYLLAFIVYLRGRSRVSRTGYALSACLFVFAILCKPTVIVLPGALLVTELLFPSTTRTDHRRFPVDGLLRTAPFFLISAGFGVLAVATEPAGYIDLPLVERPFLAAATTCFYLCRVLVPQALSPLYAAWEVDPTSFLWWLVLIAAVSACWAVVGLRKTLGAPIVWGLATFVIGFFPAIGLLKFGYFRLSYVADHFLYLSMVGASCCIGVVLDGLLRHTREYGRAAAYGLIAFYLAFLGFEANRYAQVWKDSFTLWTHVIRQNPDSWPAHTFMGHAYLDTGNMRQAEAHFRKSLELRLRYAEIYNKRANDYRLANEHYKADRSSGRAEEVREGLSSAYYNLGNVMLRSNRLPEAMDLLSQALQRKPDFVEALNNMGIALLESGNRVDAIRHFQRALDIDPKNADALYNLGLARK